MVQKHEEDLGMSRLPVLSLRERDFRNTRWCARVNQRHLSRIRESVVVAEKKLSSVRSFIILRSVERLTSFKKNNFA